MQREQSLQTGNHLNSMIKNTLNKEQRREVRAYAEKLAAYYELFNWTWYDCDGVPSAKDIEKVILALCNDIRTEQCGQISTGGITVSEDDTNFLTITWGPTSRLYL